MTETVFLALYGFAYIAAVGFMIWLGVHLFKPIVNQNRKDEQYDLIEEIAINNYCEKIGINVDKYLASIELKNTKSFKRKLEAKIVKDFFKEDEKKESK